MLKTSEQLTSTRFLKINGLNERYIFLPVTATYPGIVKKVAFL